MATRRLQATDPGQSTSQADPVVRLCLNYFFPCRELREHLAAAKDVYETAHSDEREQLYRESFGVFVRLWLASLFPVCDGFRKLGLKDPEINESIGLLMGGLRTVARNVGAYQEKEDFWISTNRFAGLGQIDMNAAEQLFQGFERFFTTYLSSAGILANNKRPLN